MFEGIQRGNEVKIFGSKHEQVSTVFLQLFASKLQVSLGESHKNKYFFPPYYTTSLLSPVGRFKAKVATALDTEQMATSTRILMNGSGSPPTVFCHKLLLLLVKRYTVYINAKCTFSTWGSRRN
jgi:hypothetical protein